MSDNGEWRSTSTSCLESKLTGIGRLPRRNENACQYQREADDVKELRTLAEKDDGHRRSEHRHHMEERRGAVRADQLHAAIEAEIGQRRGEYRDVEQRQQVRRIQLYHRAREQLPYEQRDKARRA